MRLSDGRNRWRDAMSEHTTIPALVDYLAQVEAVLGRSAFSHRAGVVLGQTGVADRANEIGAAQDFLLALMLDGHVVTADALLTQPELARTLLGSGGDYLLVVKENQPTLHEEVVEAFAPEVAELGAVGRAGTVTQHGDRIEPRQLVAVTALAHYSDWPGARQALRLERHTLHKRTGRLLRAETACAVTSLGPERATPGQLLALWRGHWSVENQLHYVRDGAFDEDRATVRAGHAPQAMAAFRNAAIGLIRCLGTSRITATCRRFMAQPHAALRALGVLPDLE
jgi:predicted transposase YbfD/YdcC